MPAARSVSDEPAVDTSWASHRRTKSGRRKTATDETGAEGAAVPSSLMAAKHTVRIATIRASPARAAARRMTVEGWDERTARGRLVARAGGGRRSGGGGRA